MAVFRHASQGVTVRNFWLWIKVTPYHLLPRGFSPRTPPGNCFSWPTKTIQSPRIKGIKLMANSPCQRGSMDTHGIHLLLVVKNNKTILCNLLLSDQGIIFFIDKNNLKCIELFRTLFAHFHRSTIVACKGLFTLPVALDHKSKWNRRAQIEFGRERCNTDQNSNKSRGYVPVLQRSRFQN